MLLATIRNAANGREWRITKSPGATAPACITGAPNMCGYWETRAELFDWACYVIGVNPDNCEWIDACTGEILSNEELLEEEYEILYGEEA